MPTNTPEFTIDVTTSDGKYTVRFGADHRLHALRYGEEWRDCVGDNLIYMLANDLQDARAALEKEQKDAREVPLCADHAQTWFTARHFKPGDCWFCMQQEKVTQLTAAVERLLGLVKQGGEAAYVAFQATGNSDWARLQSKSEHAVQELTPLFASTKASMVSVAEFTPHRNCSQERYDRTIEHAQRISAEVVGANNVRVWYDPIKDFTHVTWDQTFADPVGVRQCDVRIYKVYSLYVKLGEVEYDLWPCPTMGQLIDYLNSKRIVSRLAELL